MKNLLNYLINNPNIKYPIILIVLIIGLLQPIVWILLFLLISKDKQDKINVHNEYMLSLPEVDLPTVTDEPVVRPEWIRSIKKEYLQSPEWKALRRQVLARDNYTCRQCGYNEQLEVHHISYLHFTQEPLSDLVTVCRDCHQTIHNHYGFDYTKKFQLLKG